MLISSINFPVCLVLNKLKSFLLGILRRSLHMVSDLSRFREKLKLYVKEIMELDKICWEDAINFRINV